MLLELKFLPDLCCSKQGFASRFTPVSLNLQGANPAITANTTIRVVDEPVCVMGITPLVLSGFRMNASTVTPDASGGQGSPACTATFRLIFVPGLACAEAWEWLPARARHV